MSSFIIASALVFGVAFVSADRQTFSLAPSNTTAIAGQNAILHCHVTSLKGLVQWSKNGIVLGYDRIVPGFNGRYRIVGNASVGEYDLSISNATLTDEATFQCQVTPAGGDPALLGSAYLSVYVLPKSVSVDRYANGSVVHLSADNTLALNLTCWSRGSKPAAVVTWSSRSGASLATTYGYVTSSSASTGATGSSLFDAWAVVTISSGSLQSDILTCRSSISVVSSSPPSVSNDVIIGVIVPSRPLISGNANSNHPMTPGQNLNLTCSSGGASSVYWYRYNGVDPQPSNVTSSTCSGVSVTSIVENRQCSSQLNTTVSSIDNGVIYGCAAVFPASGDVIAADPEIRLTVFFGPSNIVMSGSSVVTSGSVLTLTCQTSASNPAAAVSWFVRGSQRFSNGISISNYTQPNGSGSSTTSVLSTIASSNDNNVSYECRASNNAAATSGGQWAVTTSTIVTVYFPPNSVSTYITDADGVQQGGVIVVHSGRPVQITCLSSSSNPPARLTWWTAPAGLSSSPIAALNPATVLDEQQTRSTSDDGGWTSTSTATIVPTPSDENRDYWCLANDIGGTALWATTNAHSTLNVLYKPQFLTSPTGVAAVIESGTLVLNATAVGNPKDISYRWTYTARSAGVIVSDCTTAINMNSTTVLVAPRSGPRLVISDVTRSDSGTYCCSAHNSEGTSLLPFVVDVQFAATIINITTALTAEPSTDVVLECTVDANPLDPTMVTWSRPLASDARSGNALPTVEFDTATGTSRLLIVSTSPSDSGDYGCRAFNGLGSPAYGTVRLTVSAAVPQSAAVRSSTLTYNAIIIIAVIIPTSIVLIVIVVLVLLFCIRRRRREIVKHTDYDTSDETSVSSSNSPIRPVSGDSITSTTTSTLYYSTKTSNPMTSYADFKPIQSVNCDKYSPKAAANKSAAAGNASQQRHLSDGSANDPSATNSDSRRTPVATQQAARPKLTSQTSTDSGYRLWNDVISEQEDEATYIEHLRDLQRHIRTEAGVPAVFIRSRSMNDRCSSQLIRIKAPHSIGTPVNYGNSGVDGGGSAEKLASPMTRLYSSDERIPRYDLRGVTSFRPENNSNEQSNTLPNRRNSRNTNNNNNNKRMSLQEAVDPPSSHSYPIASTEASQC